MDDLKAFLDGLFLPLTLGVFGGIARLCRIGWVTWRQFAGSIVVSAFTGVIVHLALQDSALSSSTQAALVAASGYSGGAVLDGLVERITNHLRAGQPWDGDTERRKETKPHNGPERRKGDRHE